MPSRQSTPAAKSTIVSSDKDMMQLIRPGVEMLDPIKQKPIGPAEVMEKFGVTPDKMVEVQALIGDSVDNVPGVPGIGPKGAAQLINEFGDLETVLAAAPAMKPSKRRDMLIEHAREGTDFPRVGAVAGRRTAADAGRESGGVRAGQASAGGLAARPGIPQRGKQTWAWMARLPLRRRRSKPRRAGRRWRCRCPPRPGPCRRPGRWASGRM